MQFRTASPKVKKQNTYALLRGKPISIKVSTSEDILYRSFTRITLLSYSTFRSLRPPFSFRSRGH